MSKVEKCCCNCLHCARWKTSKGIECHCDLTNRYLSYVEVMETDIECSNWEKEIKWDEQEKHDNEIYNKAIDDFVAMVTGWNMVSHKKIPYIAIQNIAEQLKKE